MFLDEMSTTVYSSDKFRFLKVLGFGKYSVIAIMYIPTFPKVLKNMSNETIFLIFFSIITLFLKIVGDSDSNFLLTGDQKPRRGGG